jgi:hypothetical protein
MAMPTRSLVSVTALAASLALACAPSPTAPSASTDASPAETAVLAEASAASRSLAVRPGVCGVEAVLLEIRPSVVRRSQTVVATFKGDASGCPALAWSVVPATRLNVMVKDPQTAVVFDNPEIKTGRLEVTAKMLVGTSRLSSTIAVAFPRTGSSSN